MKVILHKLFPYAPYLNEYIGFEMDIPDDGDPIAEVETLRQLAEKSHRERYPQLYQNGSELIVESFAPPVQQVVKVSSKEQQILNFKEAITTCTSMKALELFKKLVERENLPALTEAYDNKLKSFQ